MEEVPVGRELLDALFNALQGLLATTESRKEEGEVVTASMTHHHYFFALLEQLLSIGLKPTTRRGRGFGWGGGDDDEDHGASFYSVLENIGRLYPASTKMLATTLPTARTAKGKGRLFLRLALTEGTLGKYLGILLTDAGVLNKYYVAGSLWHLPEYVEMLTGILRPLEMLTFPHSFRDIDYDRLPDSPQIFKRQLEAEAQLELAKESADAAALTSAPFSQPGPSPPQAAPTVSESASSSADQAEMEKLRRDLAEVRSEVHYVRRELQSSQESLQSSQEALQTSKNEAQRLRQQEVSLRGYVELLLRSLQSTPPQPLPSLPEQAPKTWQSTAQMAHELQKRLQEIQVKARAAVEQAQSERQREQSAEQSARAWMQQSLAQVQAEAAELRQARVLAAQELDRTRGMVEAAEARAASAAKQRAEERAARQSEAESAAEKLNEALQREAALTAKLGAAFQRLQQWQTEYEALDESHAGLRRELEGVRAREDLLTRRADSLQLENEALQSTLAAHVRQLEQSVLPVRR